MRANGHHAAHRGNQHVDCSRLGQEALESTPSNAVGCVSEAGQIEKFFYIPRSLVVELLILSGLGSLGEAYSFLATCLRNPVRLKQPAE
jgi:hypothetical protein